ncbi:hypothetical protein [Nocardiopsis composta]|uniref:Uncharacterized protein n=1 Tax=Nocardiopsis composta TaxID=157465 RepID=A0A7W8VBR7_9ACTN|nr:hypothetical protein [Nocardiopsis composta]MBB5430646.1 hypothetical protein [Nocardiopsis composta]HLU95847.1 hypothetical protein [Thermobifida alba]
MSPAKTIRAPFACALSAALAVSACATGRHVDLDDVFAHQEEWPLVADPEEATGELCADEPGCVQAYTTAGADFLRFGSEEEAERAAAAAGDPVHRSGTTVIRFTDDSLIPEEREAVADWFDYNFVADTDLDEVFAEEVTGFYLQSDPREATGELCGEEFDCVQAYTTDQADYLRFESPEQAGDAAARIGADAHLSNYIVVRFTDPELTGEQRAKIAESIDGIHDSDAG